MGLQPISSKQFQQYRSRYHGGLTVIDVRPDSPAAKQGIRRGDVLVGMHIWETVSLENVNYILGRSDFTQLDPLKFYIIRGSETSSRLPPRGDQEKSPVAMKTDGVSE